MTRETVETKKAPAAIGPYSQAIKTDGLVFCSGQIGFDPTTGKLAADDVQGQTKQVMENLKAILEAAGSSIDDIVKTTIFLVDGSHYTLVNLTYSSYFSANPPARSTVTVKALPVEGALVEIEAIATLS